MKKQPRSKANPNLKKVACTVSAAALMLGVSPAATVGMHFMENYCGSAAYSGFPVTITAFGIAPNGWENLAPMDTGYSGCPSPMQIYTLNQVVSTNTSTGGLNPIASGSVSVTWSANGANFSGFAGYGGKPPSYAYDGQPPSHIPTGEWQIYSTFLRDGLNFGIDPTGTPSYTHCGDNTQPVYVVDITGLKSLFTNSPFVIELIAAADSMQTLTNAFIIDETASTTNSVSYPGTPTPYDEGGTCSQWVRGHGGGLSTVSGTLNTDHIKITSNHPQHGGTGVPPTGYDNAGTISGFIITDKPVITMSPQSILGNPGDSVTLNPYAIGVGPLSYKWRRNGAAISGATNSSYTISSLNAGNSGNYDLVVTNVYGSATSAVSVVTVDLIKLAITPGLVADSNPANPERDGLNNGAKWLASSSDGTINRSGVMQFAATNTNSITVSGSTNFDSSTGTMMFWMRSAGTDGSAAGSIGAAVFGRPGSALVNDLILVQEDGGSILFNAPATANVITSGKTISDNNWHLIVLTYDQSVGGGAALYIDGTLDTTNANSAAWTSPAGQPWQFGSTTAGTLRAYNGLLDDLRFYNRQLTASEVSSIFSGGGLVDTSALQMQLTFNTAPQEGLSLTWQAANSVLQSATNVKGPYSDINAAQAPYYVVPNASAKFYRYRFPNSPRSLTSNPYQM